MDTNLLQTYFYIEDISGSTNTITMATKNWFNPDLEIEYSYNTIEWVSVKINSSGSNTFTVPANSKIYFRGYNTSFLKIITCNKKHNVGGNIMSLLYGSEFHDKTNFSSSKSQIFQDMFYDNINLINAKDLMLPATTLSSYCYDCMFYGCTNLISGPKLPATNLANGCYRFMFYGTNVLPDCDNIDFNSMDVVYSNGVQGLFAGTKITDEDLFNILPINPKTNKYCLPYTWLGGSYHAYAYMFQDCKHLKTAPELPAKFVNHMCYAYMFSGCTSLVNAPELPSLQFESNAYESMFSGCTSLVNAPELPSTSLSESCYANMFSGCTSLKNVPKLPSTKLQPNCYYKMFEGCTNLDYIETNANILNSDYNEDWVKNVASNGTFIMNPEATYNPDEVRGDSGIPYNWIVKNSYTPTHMYFINKSRETNQLIILNNNKNINYLVDSDTEWQTLPKSGKHIIPFKNGVTLKGINQTLDGINIKTNNYCNLQGNIMCLIYGDDYIDKTILPEGSTKTFYKLFENADKIIDASNLLLPLSTIPNNACQSMFQGCSSLTNAPKLPAINLGKNCYHHMFTGCKSLKSIPELPAIDLTNSCYHGMFMGCENIPKNIKIALATLSPNCYSNMFLGCDNIKSINLPATQLTKGCYNGLLNNCKQVNKIIALFENIETDSIKKWVDNVAQEGKFMYSPNMIIDENINLNSILNLPSGWTTQVYEKIEPNYLYIENTTNTETQIGFGLDYVSQDIMYNFELWQVVNIEYSYDKLEWVQLPIDINKEITWVSIPSNSKIYLRGNNKSWNNIINNSELLIESGWDLDDIYYYAWESSNTIITTSPVNVGGDITTLLYGDSIPDEILPEDLDYCFNGLFGTFWGNENTYYGQIIDASKLILPEVVGCSTYQYMFSKCSSLTAAPELPATTLADSCYSGMFSGCTSLTTSPELPATTLAPYCYSEMFYNSNVIPNYNNINFYDEEIVHNDCLCGLFSGTNITDEDLFNILPINPETGKYYLPVMTLTESCYNMMFSSCKYLKTAPELPATTLADSCYFNMFYNCSSLTTPPELPATTLVDYCYQRMFCNCTSLTTTPELPATELVNGCYCAMFEGCSSLTSVSELPATELVEGCYFRMFANCTSLTTAPELPGTELVDSCYYQIFMSCKKLQHVTALFTNTPNTDSATGNWLWGVSSTGTFVMSSDATWNPENYRGDSGIPTGWTVLTHEE